MALLSYRATPLPWCGLSPAKLLMGQTLRTDIPQVKEMSIPNWSHFSSLNEKFKAKQKHYYDHQHRVKSLPSLPDNTSVWVNTQGKQVPGRIIQPDNSPRSYWLNTLSGEVRRNRSDITLRPGTTTTTTTEQETTSEQPRVIATHTQTGITIRPPERLTY